METQGSSSPCLFTVGNMNVHIDPTYMEQRRRLLAQNSYFSLQTLLTNAQRVLENLSPEGRRNFTQHVNQVAYSFAHSANKDPVLFLTKLFIEVPDANEINRRFFVARWTEQFESEDLHTAYLNAFCVREAIFNWDSTSMAIHH